ncbi:MAG: hypothetical protein MEQ07_10790 [Aquimonas sp.]|nr:hypothetical protein [Aquimonas sp.]
MASIFERILGFLSGAVPEDPLTKVLRQAISDGGARREFEHVGVFVLAEGDEEWTRFSAQATPEAAAAAIGSMDWESGIHFVVAVPRPGLALAFSGCLSPDDGFSVSFFDREAGVELVCDDPPASLAEATSDLSAFVRGEGSWKARFRELDGAPEQVAGQPGRA